MIAHLLAYLPAALALVAFIGLGLWWLRGFARWVFAVDIQPEPLVPGPVEETLE